MAQQGKQMRVSAREGFAYHSVKLVLLANCNRCEVDSNTFFLSGEALYPLKILLCPNSDLFDKLLYLQSLQNPRKLSHLFLFQQKLHVLLLSKEGDAGAVALLRPSIH
jgi:hypothetical protein